MNNEITKVCYEEIQNNCNKYAVSENSCSKNIVHFQEKHPREIAFLNKVAGYLTFYECSSGKFIKFSEQFS